MIRSRSCLSACLLAATAAAQVPHDVAVVLEAAPWLEPNYRLVDVFGRGVTTVRDQAVFMLPPPVSVATDPNDAGSFFFQANPSSLAGTWRSDVGVLAQIGLTTWGPWLQQPAARVEVSATRVLTLRNGLVEACNRSGSPATVLFSVTDAVDLAAAEPRLYVAANSGGSSPVVEFDLGTSQQRIVGNYIGVRCIAVSPLAPELCLGTDGGSVLRVDIATGVVVGTVATGLGPIVAVGYTRFGTLVYADGQTLRSELVPAAPLYVSSAGIIDFGVTTRLVASAVPFGHGCGLGAQATWAVNGTPTLGNGAFAIGLRAGVPASFAVCVLGASRLQSSVLGGPLPIDLAVIGAAGCPLLVDPALLLLLGTDAAGRADQPLPIPATPSLAGVEWCGQWLLPDAAVGALGLAITEGLVCALW